MLWRENPWKTVKPVSKDQHLYKLQLVVPNPLSWLTVKMYIFVSHLIEIIRTHLFKGQKAWELFLQAKIIMYCMIWYGCVRSDPKFVWHLCFFSWGQACNQPRRELTDVPYVEAVSDVVVFFFGVLVFLLVAPSNQPTNKCFFFGLVVWIPWIPENDWGILMKGVRSELDLKPTGPRATNLPRKVDPMGSWSETYEE